MASSGPSALVQPLRADVARRAPGSAEAAQRALADFGAEMVRLVGGADADTALSPYSLATVLAMARAGADIIELGIPFSDPMADGPVVQKASERALARGIAVFEQQLAQVACRQRALFHAF